MNSEYDYLVKLIVVGDSGVGKSSLLHRFSHRKFNPDFVSTIGVDFEVREIDVDGKKVKMQCWDCAGNERFRSITTSYFRGAAAIVVVFDVTDPQSIASLPGWVREVRDHNPGGNIVIVGNKIDLLHGKSFHMPTLVQQTLDHLLPNFKLILSSASSGQNVDLAFEQVTIEHVREQIARTPLKPKTNQTNIITVSPPTPHSCCKIS